jgi:hypothetical protein
MTVRSIVEMSVEIIFPTMGEHEENFSGVVPPIDFCICNYIIVINLQADMLNHSAFCSFPRSLVVKP